MLRDKNSALNKLENRSRSPRSRMLLAQRTMEMMPARALSSGKAAVIGPPKGTVALKSASVNQKVLKTAATLPPKKEEKQ